MWYRYVRSRIFYHPQLIHSNAYKYLQTNVPSQEAATENKIDTAPPRAIREKAFRNKWLFKFHRCTQFLYQLSKLVA